MLNMSADYALRAVLYMARHDHGACSADVIAQATGIPRNYLGKVLHTLVRTRVLDSVRGPRGGFRLGRTSDRITLEAVVAPFQRLPDRRMCLLGNGRCDPKNACAAHQRWSRTAAPVTAFFRETSIALLLAPMSEDGVAGSDESGVHAAGAAPAAETSAHLKEGES